MVDYAVKEERLYIDAWHPGRRGDREKYVDGIVNLVGIMPRKLILNSNSKSVFQVYNRYYSVLRTPCPLYKVLAVSRGAHILPRPVSAPASSQIILHLILRICMTVDEQVSLCIDDSFFITSWLPFILYQ